MVLMALVKAHNQRVELESRLLSGLNKEREESYQRGLHGKPSSLGILEPTSAGSRSQRRNLQ